MIPKINEIEILCKELGYACIIEDDKYKTLRHQARHYTSNTYEHSLRVAYLTYKMTKDKTSIPVALLHDYCDRPTGTIFSLFKPRTWYAFDHPVVAAQNAYQMLNRLNFEFFDSLNDEKIKAIETHMFPLAFGIPKGKTAWALTITDKFCAIYDFFTILNKKETMKGC